MQCPKCHKQSLRRFNINDSTVVVDACKSCKGVWFDAGELRDTLPVAARELRLRHDAKDSQRSCPKCEVSLKTFNYPRTKVEIDMCPDCEGLWLDAGEFKAIKAAREKLLRQATDNEFLRMAENISAVERQPRTPSKHSESTKREAWRIQNSKKITEVTLGIVVPVMIVLWSLYYASLDVVHIVDLEESYKGTAKNEPVIYIPIVLIASGIGTAMFSWFWLSNQPSTEHNWQVGMLVAAVVGGLGTLVLVGLLLVVCMGPEIFM